MNETAKEKHPALHKELGVLDVFCVASGAMISSGLFVLPGIVYAYAGPAACLVYLLAGLLVIPALLCKAELATAMPKAGGTYFFIDRSLGAAFGTLGGIASWFSLSLKSAFALFGIGAFGLVLSPHFPPWGIKLAAITCCVVITFVNARGVKHAGRMQIVLVMLLIGGLIIYVFRGLGHMNAAHFEDFTAKGWPSIWAATGMAFVSYGGLTKVASLAEEIKNPGRNLPLGMLMSFSIVTVLYVLVVLVTVGLLGPKMLGTGGTGDLNSLIHGAKQSSGLVGVIIVSIAAMLAYVSTANAGVMSASRISLAMSRDQLLPETFSRIHHSRGTPLHAIGFTSVFMIASILFLKLETLVKVASTMMILLFLLVCLATILMRESRIENYRPQFYAPFYPYVPIAGIIAYFFLVLEMGTIPLMLTAVFFGGGLLWYGFYGRIRVNRESALIRIAKRTIPNALISAGLDDELRDILRARDDIVVDRFDRLIRTCPILDIEGEIDRSSFFHQVADELATSLEFSPDEIYALLEEREQQTSTVLKPGLAVPHIVVEGEGRFHILLARSKEGIAFGDDVEPVHAIFVLAGSRDLRNYHLRVLMFIAQITQEADFEERWMRAPSTAALRDLILLAKRTRLPDEYL